MQTFLNQVAKHILENHQNELLDIAIVLPNRRSHVFLKEELAKEIDQNIWAPKIYSLEDFVAELSDLANLDQLDLILELYEIHKQIEQEKAELLDEFLNWGNILLHDFNEVDRYLVDADELYAFLSEARALEVWNVDTGEITDFQKKYLAFWKKMGRYYHLFRAQLTASKKAYQGLSFRIAAEEIEKRAERIPYKKIYFAGFNALTKAEEIVLKHFESIGTGQFLWDADSFYMKDKNQEAGKFLRKQLNLSNPNLWIQNHFKDSEKAIDIYGISGQIGQAKLVGEILTKAGEKNTAVVLADENLLIPILDSIPKEIETFNVTMGYPLSNASLYDFFEKYLQLCQQIEAETSKNNYFYKDLIPFLEHPIWKSLSRELEEAVQSILQKVKSQNILFLNIKSLESINSTLGISLFEANNNGEQIIQKLIQFCLKIDAEPSLSSSILNREMNYNFLKCFNRILEFTSEATAISAKALLQLYRQVVSTYDVSFIGEPLSGLQIMGVLETRTLDFENIILTSLNEGILPSGKTQNTFIPFDIKRKFEMPSYKEKDAIFAYHFYRLIQRAKNIHLIYNSNSSGLNAGEKSRFILQLENEIQSYNPNITINNRQINTKMLKNELESTIIQNNEGIQEKIIQHLKNGISPSAINTFLTCTLDYYYKYILNLETVEEVSEEIELSDFGSIVHKALENLYRPYINQILDKIAIQEIKSKSDTVLFDAFKAKLNQEPNTGNLKIAYEVSKIYLQKLVKLDESEIKLGNEIIIKDLEVPFLKPLHLFDYGIKIKGIIDRIDTFNGKTRIIDYKTGKVEDKDLIIRKLDPLIEGKLSKAFQMLCYYAAIKQEFANVEVGIISLKMKETKFIPLQLVVAELDEHPEEELIKMIFDELVSMMTIKLSRFEHNTNSQYCNFCK